MDECLVMVSLDLSGRPFYADDLDLDRRWIATFDAELAREFFHAVAANGMMNLHIHQFRGGNAHHIVEAAFKAFGRALDAATRIDERVEGVPSTKGVL
jgi:imidazoleglycerol-phosphate dehydratase